MLVDRPLKRPSFVFACCFYVVFCIQKKKVWVDLLYFCKNLNASRPSEHPPVVPYSVAISSSGQHFTGHREQVAAVVALQHELLAASRRNSFIQVVGEGAGGG